MKTKFETQTCSRCGGSGSYSYNQRHGAMCYGCNGSGKQRTKRGAAATQFFLDSLEKPVVDIKIGDLVKFDGKWREVARGVEPDLLNDGRVIIHILPNIHLNTCESGREKSGKNTDEFRALRAAAIEYQNTLTKAGEPQKRKLRK